MFQLSQVTRSNWFWIVLIALGLAFIFTPRLMTYTLSGDDLIMIDIAPRSVREVAQKLIDFRGQYRPLTHTLFGAYRVLLPHARAIQFVNFWLMIGVSSLFFLNLRRLITPWLAAMVTFVSLLSPIFFYHFFANTFENIFLLIFLFGSLLLVNFQTNQSQKRWKVAVGAILLLLAMLSKESFLVNALVFFLILFQNLPIRKFVAAVLSTSALIGVYLILHFTLYESTGEYAIAVSLQSMISMAIDMACWLVGYPRGWQYGVAGERTIITYITALISLVGWGLIAVPVIASIQDQQIFSKRFFLKLLESWKVQFIFLIAFVASLAPFFVTERSLVFYCDVAFLILIFWFAYNFRTWKSIWFVPVLLGVLLQFGLYYDRWHQYSFVADANREVQNYQRVLIENDFHQFDQICILEHNRGEWGSNYGKAAQMLWSFNGRILSSRDSAIPKECAETNSLILRNDGWEYELVE